MTDPRPGAAPAPDGAAAAAGAAGPSAVDAAFTAVQAGDHDAFARWLGLVEMPLRASLRSFAAAVDIEAALQECLLRMWRLSPRLRLEGRDASLRYAHRMLRNLALAEARRLRRVSAADLAELEHRPELAVEPPPPPDPALRRLIDRCIARLPERPRIALRARLADHGCSADRELAAGLGMQINTFFQNIGRARRLLRECLERLGVAPEEMTP